MRRTNVSPHDVDPTNRDRPHMLTLNHGRLREAVCRIWLDPNLGLVTSEGRCERNNMHHRGVLVQDPLGRDKDRRVSESSLMPLR